MGGEEGEKQISSVSLFSHFFGCSTLPRGTPLYTSLSSLFIPPFSLPLSPSIRSSPSGWLVLVTAPLGIWCQANSCFCSEICFRLARVPILIKSHLLSFHFVTSKVGKDWGIPGYRILQNLKLGFHYQSAGSFHSCIGEDRDACLLLFILRYAMTSRQISPSLDLDLFWKPNWERPLLGGRVGGATVMHSCVRSCACLHVCACMCVSSSYHSLL